MCLIETEYENSAHLAGCSLSRSCSTFPFFILYSYTIAFAFRGTTIRLISMNKLVTINNNLYLYFWAMR